MEREYKVITLCGSTRFKEEFLETQRLLTLQGKIVISLGFFEKTDTQYQKSLTKEIVEMLSELHKRKIDLSDEIFVINKNGYIGESTRAEILYAKKVGKNIDYLEKQ